MDQSVLAAQVRETKGKRAARKFRKNNRIPAVFYGPKTEPIKLTMDYPDFDRIIKQGTAENMIINLKIQSDQGTETKKAMIKDLMIDPIKDTYLHADFYEISMDKEITARVPLRLTNTPEGITKGGILQHIRRELAISCLPDNLIDSIEIDVSDLDIGDSLHIRDIDLPEGITCIEQDHLTIAVIAAPSVLKEEEAEEEIEVEEGEAEPEAESAEEPSQKQDKKD